ncbi:MAG: cytochrome C oxidase subunit III [Arcobacter sp.]|nr:MAG: cytochrome C oxidase subunit III [Arcobacter sp.]
MKFIMIVFLSFLSLYARNDTQSVMDKDSFITEKEYAQHLYKNPRGIGCNKCHGKKGEGMVISKYKHKGENRVLETKEINTMNYEKFSAALKNKVSIMPKYFLTKKEIRALYNYLHKSEKGK